MLEDARVLDDTRDLGDRRRPKHPPPADVPLPPSAIEATLWEGDPAERFLDFGSWSIGDGSTPDDDDPGWVSATAKQYGGGTLRAGISVQVIDSRDLSVDEARALADALTEAADIIEELRTWTP